MPARRATARSRPPAGPAVPGPFLILAGLAGAGAAQAAGLPGLVVLLAGVAAGCWVEALAPRPELDEAPKRGVAPGPASVRAARERARWRSVAISTTAPAGALVPGWPPLASFVGTLLAAVAGATLPVAHLYGHVHISVGTARALDALAAWWLAGGVSYGMRSSAGTACPGTRLTDFARWQAGAGALAGALVGGAGAAALRSIPAGAMEWRPLPGAAALVAAGAFFGAWAGASRPALAHWRRAEALRARWAQPWAELRFDPAPALVDLRKAGQADRLVFEAAPVHGARAFWPISAKLAPYEPGALVVVLEQPDEGPAGPVPGTRHQRRFALAVWPNGLPELTSPELGDDEAELAAHCAMALALEERGYGRPVPLGVEKMSSGAKAVWRSRWAWPGGPSLAEVRPLRADLAERFACPVLVDHRADVVWFGAIGDPEAGLAPEDERALQELADEDEWDGRWALVLKQGANPPTPQWATAKDLPLADGNVVHRLAFVTRGGVGPSSFQRLEPQLATVLDAAPFVAICGWPGQGRPGDRHPQAFAVYWSESPAPASPEALAPSPGATWVLAGMLNQAFDQARLERPEVVAARPLSAPDSPAALWEVVLRLHGGVTMADVSAKAPALRQALGASWLAVEPGGEGAVLLAGASPRSRSLRLVPGADPLRLASLEWQAAWAAAGLKGAEGHRPRLVAVSGLPANPAVEAFDFVLPPGVDSLAVRQALPKAATAMSYAWVDARPSPVGPQAVRLLASAEDPLPSFVPFDFGAGWSWEEGLAFATGIEGEPVRFSPVESPHLLLAGATGSGKSSAAQALLWAAAAAGATVVVVDPVKGGADFAFLRPWAAAFATSVAEAASVLGLVLAEVGRRKRANAAAGVGSWAELPDPPAPLVVMVDEFTSLVGAGARLPRARPDETPAEAAERGRAEAEAAARAGVATGIARLAREARSAGVSLLLATQRLSASMLDRMPGAEDLKVNLARALLGRASLPERQVALRDALSAPSLGDLVPKGRGWFEPLSGPPQVVQVWWASQDDLAAALRRRREPPPPGSAFAELVGPDEDDEIVLSLDDLD
jgi:S-DNA-T family DNA segregation ATPase FtsK/SpoIIIE